MKKSDVQALYSKAKRTKSRHNRPATHSRTRGCPSCGRVTWKPYH